MARKALIEKHRNKKKFATREYNRCPLCGRSHGFMRRFGMCRICFRRLANFGHLPGVLKSSW